MATPALPDWAADLVASSTYKDRYEFANRVMQILDVYSSWPSAGKGHYCDIFDFWIVFILFTQIFLPACKPSNPFPELKEWDLLIISDSSNYGVGQHYAKLIEADMHVKVNLHDCFVGGMSIGSALQALQSGKSLYPELGHVNCQTPWSDHAWTDLINEAEVMVLFGNPLDSYPPDGSWNIPEDPNSCVMGGV